MGHPRIMAFAGTPIMGGFSGAPVMGAPISSAPISTGMPVASPFTGMPMSSGMPVSAPVSYGAPIMGAPIMGAPIMGGIPISTTAPTNAPEELPGDKLTPQECAQYGVPYGAVWGNLALGATTTPGRRRGLHALHLMPRS